MQGTEPSLNLRSVSMVPKNIAILAIVFIYSAGCGGVVPKAPPPRLAAPPPIYFSDRLPRNDEKMAAYGLPNSYFGISSPSPTGVEAVGLFSSAMGALTNIWIEHASKNLAEKHGSLFQVDLVRLINSASKKYPTLSPKGEIATRYELVPATSIYHEDDDHFNFNCYLWAYLYDNGRVVWKARYAINSTRSYATDGGNVRAALIHDIRECLLKSIALFELHSRGDQGLFKDAEIDQDGTTLSAPVIHSLLPDRLVYVDNLGLTELSKRNWRGVKLK